jgi:hypothetical protein
MALYKYPDYLQVSDHQAFDLWHNPGVPTPYSGIYRCEGCGKEAASIYGAPLPPQDHHQHTIAQGAIRWRLIVAHS